MSGQAGPQSSAERADQKWRVDALLYGEKGLTERFGLLAARQHVARGRHEELPWRDVVAIATGKITVRDREFPMRHAESDVQGIRATSRMKGF